MSKNKNIEESFEAVVSMIMTSRTNAMKAVNTELVNLYWNVGKYISEKIASTEWGNKIVDSLAVYINETYPDIRGFTRRGLYRMKQFFETYRDNQNVSTLLTQIPWSCHLHIMSKTKSIEEKEFYINLSIKENLSVRELERQIDSCYFERVLMSENNMSTLLTQSSGKQDAIFKDTYVFEFLSLSEPFSESDLQRSLINNLKKFILEIGRDFSFVGECYRVQVGGSDYYIDLLFYHRALRCLVAIELKTDDFKPEYLGKMNFYLEALDRDVKKEYENPSIGLILCKSKNTEVVEYAMSRNLSPTMVSEYETKLIDKNLLKQKLRDFYELSGKKFRVY